MRHWYSLLCSCCLFVLPLIANSQIRVTHQRLYDTGSTMPAHNTERALLFEKEPIEKGKIIFLGNSITEAGKWAELTGNNNVINRGIGGDITFDLLKRIDDVIKRTPSKLFLLIGINDISKDIPDEVIVDNCKKIISKVQQQSPATKMYVQSILPLNTTITGFPQHYDKMGHVTSVNRLLKKMTVQAGCTFVNLYSLFLDADKRLDKKYTTDGLHLKAEGYKIWVTYLQQKKYL